MHTGFTAATGALIVLTMLAGCHEPPQAGPGDGSMQGSITWSLSGIFTEQATQADLEDLEQRLGAFDAQLDVMESYPMQFRIWGPVRDDCPAVQDLVGNRSYVADVGNCLAVTRATDPSEPTSDDNASRSR